MRLPFYSSAEPENSEPFQLVHCSVFRSWPARNSKFQNATNRLTVGVKNVTNTIQSRPIIAPEAPFSEDFDASRIYAPIEQRRLFVKWAWTM
jgi:hypothetical protein